MNRLVPPLGAAVTYARELHRWITERQKALSDQILGAWDYHLHRGRLRHDARRIIPSNKIVPNISVIETVAARVAKRATEQNAKLLGLPTRKLGIDPNVVDQFRERNINLITKLDEDEIARLQGLLSEADQGAWRVEDLRKNLQEEFGITKRHADLIARDQVLKLNGQITQHQQTKAGVESYIWRTSGDERVRSTHQDLDGQQFRWDDPPETNDAGERNHPGGDYQCRCTADPVIEGLDE